MNNKNIKTKILKLSLIVSIFTFEIFSASQLFSQDCNLPLVLPTNLEKRDAYNRDIAYCFAPHVHHLISGEDSPQGLDGIGDLMTSVFFDGDIITADNWDNLEDYVTDPNNQEALNPVVYYSVVWTEDNWYIIYAFYHARDFAIDDDLLGEFCHDLDAHHSDMEGVVLKVKRPTDDEGAYVVASKSGCHHGYDERPYITDWGSEVGAIFENETHIVVSIDNATHCVKHDYLDQVEDGYNPCEPEAVDFIDYTPTEGEAWINLEQQEGEYTLVDFHEPGGLWDERYNQHIFESWAKFPNTINDVKAKAPWGWIANGMITHDPKLFFIDHCFDQSPYLINAYISDDIPLEEGPCVPPEDFVPETISIGVTIQEGQDVVIDLSNYNEALANNHIYFDNQPPWGISIQGKILSIKYVEAGSYFLDMLANTPCEVESFLLEIKVNILDGPWVPQEDDDHPPVYSISPNPAFHQLQVSLIGESNNDGQITYYLSNELGDVLDTDLLGKAGGVIDISYLQNGNYYLTIESNTLIETHSFIKI